MLKLQQECFNNIKTLCVNYKKDAATRKTKEYLIKRLNSLQSQWIDFEKRHQQILAIHENEDLQYLTEDVFSKAREMVETTLQNMEDLLKQYSEKTELLFDFTGMLESSSDDATTVLLEKQECNFKALNRAMSKVNVHPDTEKWELEDYLSTLKCKWDVVDQQHWELEAKLKGSNLKYYNAFISIESKYDELRRQLNLKIRSTAHYANTTPKIVVPEFSGSYTQWISFKDLFLETIHNNPLLNNAQKMQHLKTRLRGEAERLVQHLTTSAENYKSCWDILVHRYDNRRLQFTTFVNSMLNLPVIQHPDCHNLKKMHDVITECLNGLSNIDVDTTSWDPLIVHLMSQKLDSTTFSEYNKDLNDHRDLPSTTDFLGFLEGKFMAYEAMKNAKKEAPSTQKQTPAPNKQFVAKKNYFEFKKNYPKTFHTTSYGTCPHCNGNHVLMQCPKFMEMDAAQRIDTVSKLRLCKNCLYSHGNAKCNSIKTCKECNLKHHTLLHMVTNNHAENGNKSNSRPLTSGQLGSHHLSKKGEMEILLTTVQLQVRASNGNYVTLRALLDQGSQVNLITESAAQLLKLERKRLNATISGVGSVSGDCKGRLQLKCKSIHSNYEFEAEALIMRKLISNLPNSSFKKSDWQHINNLKLADPEFNVSRPVDILLGADVYSDIILDGVLKGSHESPIAQHTHLGWILCGKLKTFNCHVTLIDLTNITKFWENEDIAKDSSEISNDDYCEQLYSNTVQRAADGKYIVEIPFHPNFEKNLGKSKHIALAQFLQQEKRLQRKNRLAILYRDFMREYADLGHMTPTAVLTNISTLPECYLPHHGVEREHSTTTKVRVVFNGAQVTSSGSSLNQLQDKGPNLQRDIQALILYWRSYKYAYTADIEKMYRCIWIANHQQKLQQIWWRDSPNDKLLTYQLCTVTYGMKSAPWLAMRTLKQLAIDEGSKFPEAAHVLQNQFYVDDLVSGGNTINEAKTLQGDLINLLKRGGMNLRKWRANQPALLENLTEDQISSRKSFDFKGDESMKMLGLGWNPNNDNFTFDWNMEGSPPTPITKRCLLSEISKLYDPLGWFSPITIAAKLLFQKVWVDKLEWNDALPVEIQNEWLKIRSELPVVKNIQLERWLGGNQNNIELLGFCDASEKAYACVIYSRVTSRNGPPTITLFAAKTRVAPLAQKTTLPRLELCGALLLAQLVQKAREAFKNHELPVRAWCDSQVVLAWLQGDVTRWERYVAHRVTKITKVIPSENWQYIKSEINPADAASRGVYPTKLLSNNLWWKGPEFLQTEEETRVQQNPICCLTTDVDLKEQTATALPKNDDTNIINELLNKCSSLNRVIRIIAWILRFGTLARKNATYDTYVLTTSELVAAKQLIIRNVQREYFENEIKLLMKSQPITNKSSIFKLNPYMDNEGVLRVGGRLNKSDLPFEMKNPIIIPHKGRYTELLIDQAHTAVLHGGARLTLAYIRQRCWIVGGNRAVKFRLTRCVRCHRHKSTTSIQLMGDLPRERVTPSRPFTNTGVDFTGHVEVKLNKGRGVRTSKGYIAIFVCMATKAVHIELVSDLSTETFIAAFQRMCARRGVPKHVYSDCGTNFIGGSHLLHHEFEEFRLLLSPGFFDEINKLEVQWHFNAPAWPSAGGLWEAAVKSLKYHLRRVLGEQRLTYEEFTTLLTQIEACMNSRPLCPLTEDPEEFYNYITPGHFLIGGPVMSLPRSDHSDVRTLDLRRRWHLTENMLQQFWKSWSNEYLTQLQGRNKWNKQTTNIKEGDIVLVKDDNLPPGKWAMGRVMEVHPGSDGKVRVTTLKTKTGVIKRPIVKLSPLPLEPAPEIDSSTHNNRDNNKTMKTSKSMKKSFVTLFTLLATMFTLTTGAPGGGGGLSQSVHITNLEPSRPIYYDTVGNLQTIHDEWTVLMYYNLSNYWSGMQKIKTYFTKLNDFCEKTDPRYCRTTLLQLSHEMELLTYYNDLLLAPHKHLSERKKRGLINGVGYIANSLFGILDQNFADKYQEDIEAIHNNENYLLALMKNQTSIVQMENQVLRKTETNINNQFTMIDEFMNQTDKNMVKIESTMEIVMATAYFNSASLATYLLLKNMRTMQELLFDCLTDVYKGHMDVHLLSPVELIEQLHIISGRLPKTLTLPIENAKDDIKDIYKLIYVKARVTSNYFLFEVHIPLTSDEDYLIYRAIPLPVNSESKITITQTQARYVAVNFQKNTYISVNENDLQLCTQLKADKFVCFKNLPIYNLHNINAPCEAKLLSHHSTTSCDVTTSTCDYSWVELHAANSWLAICCGTCTFRTICGSDITTHTMTSSSVISLAQGCLLQSQDLTIHSHNEYSTDMKMSRYADFPDLNMTVNNIIDLSRQHKRIPIATRRETAEIEDKILALKGNEELPSTVVSYDTHLYVITYCLLGAVIISFIIWIMRTRGSLCYVKRENVRRQLPLAEDIELRNYEKHRSSEATAATPPTPAVRTAAVDNVVFNFDD